MAKPAVTGQPQKRYPHMTQINIHRVENGWIVNHHSDDEAPQREHVFTGRADLLEHVEKWIAKTVHVEVQTAEARRNSEPGLWCLRCDECGDTADYGGGYDMAIKNAKAAGWNLPVSALGGVYCPKHNAPAAPPDWELHCSAPGCKATFPGTGNLHTVENNAQAAGWKVDIGGIHRLCPRHNTSWQATDLQNQRV